MPILQLIILNLKYYYFWYIFNLGMFEMFLMNYLYTSLCSHWTWGLDPPLVQTHYLLCVLTKAFAANYTMPIYGFLFIFSHTIRSYNIDSGNKYILDLPLLGSHCLHWVMRCYCIRIACLIMFSTQANIGKYKYIMTTNAES